jgi:hypothetical protein
MYLSQYFFYISSVQTCTHICLLTYLTLFDPPHDKTNIMGLRPAWIQTSPRIRAVWSGSMLFAISFSTCNRVGKRTTWILIRLCGCAGWSGSMLIANPLCWFRHGAAHLKNILIKGKGYKFLHNIASMLNQVSWILGETFQWLCQ